MEEIILVSHGYLAEGMLDTVKMIVGDTAPIKAYSAYHPREYEPFDEIEAEVEANPNNHYIIITDILGGSVNTNLFNLLNSNLNNNIDIITGMNLPLIINIVMNLNVKDSKQTLVDIVEESKEGIIYCNKLLN